MKLNNRVAFFQMAFLYLENSEPNIEKGLKCVNQAIEAESQRKFFIDDLNTEPLDPYKPITDRVIGCAD